MQTIDKLNRHFANNKFKWVEPKDLHYSTQEWLRRWVYYFGWTAEMHHKPIDGHYIFRLNHPQVKYLIHIPESELAGESAHMWGDAKFENMNNNDALCKLSGREDLLGVFEMIDNTYAQAQQQQQTTIGVAHTPKKHK